MDKVHTCEEALALFKNGKISLTPPAPYNTSLSAEWIQKLSDREISNSIVVKTDKLTMPNYPIGLAEMPSKNTFPVAPNVKLNVPVNPNKALSDLLAGVQDTLISEIEAKKSMVRSFRLSA